MDPITIIGIIVALLAAVAATVVVLRGSASSPSRPASDAGAPSMAASKSTANDMGAAPSSGAAAIADPASAAAAVDEHKLHVDIYFGSQTGTAENFAKTLAKEGRAAGMAITVTDLQKFNTERLASATHVSVFLMATYGEGDPTDNAVDFMKHLKTCTGGEKPYARSRFTVFGLGNKQYEHYNAMGKAVNAGMEAAGATRVYDYGEGDDDGSMEEDFLAWKRGLWPALQAAHARSSGGDDPSPVSHSEDDAEEDVWRVKVTPGGAAPPVPVTDESLAADRAATAFFKSRPMIVTVNKELRAVTGVGASTRHLELALHASQTYVTADNLYLLPHNDTRAVAAVASACGLDLDAVVSVSHANSKNRTLPFPSPCTMRTLLTQYVDLAACPKRDFLSVLSRHATDPAHAAALALQASDTPEGREAYNTDILTPMLSAFELFAIFPSLRVPLDVIVNAWPRMHARAYTISSSSRVQPRNVAVTVSVIDEPKPDHARLPAARRLHGLASSYMSSANVGHTLHGYVRESTFRLPVDARTPIVCVGPGTGFAPVRAFLHERAAARAAGELVGETHVFFGCRKRAEDHIYADEMDAFVRDGTITSLHLAFSREGSEKVYVQHKLAEQAALAWRVLAPVEKGGAGGHMYVCGGTRMGHDVQEALRERVFGGVDGGALPPAQAAEAVKRMQDVLPKRYVSELWSASA